MCPKKLTDKDKKEILSLYRHTNETTSSLAESYDMNPSSVSHFLKNALSKEEYQRLIAQKLKGHNQPDDNKRSTVAVASSDLPSSQTSSEEQILAPPILQKQQLATLQIEKPDFKDLEEIFDYLDESTIEQLDEETDSDARPKLVSNITDISSSKLNPIAWINLTMLFYLVEKS